MITKTEVIFSSSFDPYHNLALEEYLLRKGDSETCTLYLWQNQNTVVIGQNQNAWQECKTNELTRDGGKLARRLSGGGAVFHDLGNLNFTFIVPRKDYDVALQTEVIRKAVSYYGLDVTRSGRNDILISGRKFSGNAFFKDRDMAYHHGTLLISSDMQRLPKYLNVSEEKLKSKGVKSVSARVANLSEFSDEITVESMKKNLVKALGEVYNIPPVTRELSAKDEEELSSLIEKYSSWEWIFGKKIPFISRFKKKFPWGDLDIQLNVQNGIIEDAAVYSDAMDCLFIKALQESFIGKKYICSELTDALKSVPVAEEFHYEVNKDIIADIENFLQEQNF